MKALCCCLKNGQFLVLFFLLTTCGTKVSAQTTGSDAVPTVTIQATTPFATATNQPGVFTVFRVGNSNAMLNVSYAIFGTASNGVDYAALSGQITIPAGAVSNTILITPFANPPSNSFKTVTLVLTSSQTDYINGSPGIATVYLDGSTNLPPEVEIDSPFQGEMFTAPANIPIFAFARDSDGSVVSVEFFADTNSLGVFTNLPPPDSQMYGIFPFILWTNAPTGNYALTMVATDNGGASATSAPVNITVRSSPPPTNLPPTALVVWPPDGSVFWTPTNIPISVATGPVASVEIFAGTNSLGFGRPILIVPEYVCTNCPPFANYSIVWTNPPPGNYDLTAVVTGNGGLTTTSAPVNISVLQGPPPNQPPVVNISSPTNGEVFTTPVNISILAPAYDPDGQVKTVAFFENRNLLGIFTNPPLPANEIPVVVPHFLWSNAPAGQYTLTAVVTDNDGASTTSAPVNVAVQPSPPLTVNIIEPKDGDVFYAPTNIEIWAKPVDQNASVTNVEFFAGTNDLGKGFGAILDPPGIDGVTGLVYSFNWENVPPGDFALTAVATDDNGASTTSAPVNITVLQGLPTNVPPVVRIISPANGSVFRAPVNVPIYAFAREPGGTVTTVEFFAGTNSLGFGQSIPFPSPVPVPLDTSSNNYMPFPPVPPVPVVFPTNIFFLSWSNAPAGVYDLTAVAAANNGVSATSAPVKIAILPSPPPPTNRPPIVNIWATDPVAIEGTNTWVWAGETNSTPTWAAWPPVIRRFFTNSAPKTATFTVRRFGHTNDDLTVPYDIGGTASNGVDYVTLPGSVTIPAAEHSAMITIVPIDNGPTNVNKTVVLTLASSTNTPPDYLLGFPRRAAALIIDSDGLRPVTGMLPDGSFHFVTPGPDAAWFCIEYSTNLTDWTPVCTNQVINGSIDFIDPDAHGNPSRFYRAVPLANGPSN